jgi:hypothetical protein
MLLSIVQASPCLFTGLRKVIEAGDVDGFTQLVWSNPKYLVGYGEAPTLLREGLCVCFEKKNTFSSSKLGEK